MLQLQWSHCWSVTALRSKQALEVFACIWQEGDLTLNIFSSLCKRSWKEFLESSLQACNSSFQSRLYGIRTTVIITSLPGCYINSVTVFFLKFSAYNLPSWVLFLAYMADMCFLGTHTIQGVVSFRGDPSKHLERCCCPLIKVLLNSIFEQMIDVFNKEMFSFPFLLLCLFYLAHLIFWRALKLFLKAGLIWLSSSTSEWQRSLGAAGLGLKLKAVDLKQSQDCITRFSYKIDLSAKRRKWAGVFR